METKSTGQWPLSLVLVLVSIRFGLIEAYDPMDPFGNITVKWDFKQINTDSTYTVLVSIYNYQLYRHVESPGWRLGWTWPGKKNAIWRIAGAEATEQGNCMSFKGHNPLPHCCLKRPVIVDMLPGAAYNAQVSNCCRGGVLSSMVQDSTKSVSSFQMDVESATNISATNFAASSDDLPHNFDIGLPGYTCSNATKVAPSKFLDDGGRRKTQALMTWQVICSYSQFRESVAPSCCVSLSSFYNDTVVSCPRCTCGCQDGPSSPQQCVKDGEEPPVLRLPNNRLDLPPPQIVTCTQHMCPIRVHWHVKLNYKEYWRVKVTITNFNIYKNYTEWNLVVQHPNLESLTQVFSFNYKPLAVYGNQNDTGVFWGIKYYNELLIQRGENGNVQTEMLFHKELDKFTFDGGWAFPRKISFNGHECVMPPPTMYPSLPLKVSSSSSARPKNLFTELSALLLFPALLFS